MLQWFQYRINHRILGTNRLMFKMGIVDKENCSFVTISQKQFCIYFGNVDMLINFGELLIKWLREEFQNIFTNWSKKDIIFGNRGM